MKILAVADYLPMADRASGDLRFYSILKMLTERHSVSFCCHDWQRQRDEVGLDELTRYQTQLEQLGIEVIRSGIPATVKHGRFDVIWFEFYYAACANLTEARFWQPQARVVIDTVDVHFHRLFAKAQLSKKAQDFAQAHATKKAELRIYKNADFVIAVTEQDRQILLQQDADIRVEVLPNIHKVPALMPTRQRLANSLVFVGGFGHEPNVDAMLFFCTEILPLIRREIPDIHVKIIGGSAPETIRNLSGSHVEVLGYVPDTAPFLESSAISIAPLRFGAGMKGKIGEAMSYGLPVVTTSVGIEGFGLTPEENVLVGDSPEEFAAQIVRLLGDAELYKKLSANGWLFIKQNYSQEAVVERVYSIFDHLDSYPVKKLSTIGLIKKHVMNTLEKHLLWRFRGT